MKSEALTIKEYIDELPDERKAAINKLRVVIKKHLPKGFAEEMNYGMIGYVVPLSVYPEGYLGKRDQPLPFISIASQKNFIAVYHMGLYSDRKLLDWFKKSYASRYSVKLDTGKSCIRFKNVEHIPYELIGELSAKLGVDEWIARYEAGRKRS